MDTNARPFVNRDGINWMSLAVFTLFHVGTVTALSSSTGGRSLPQWCSLLDFFELGYRNGISASADPSFLQTAEGGSSTSWRPAGR